MGIFSNLNFSINVCHMTKIKSFFLIFRNYGEIRRWYPEDMDYTFSRYFVHMHNIELKSKIIFQKFVCPLS